MSTLDIARFENVAGKTRKRLSGANRLATEYLNGLIHQILMHRGVAHPFLEHYAAHGLSPDDERVLFSECYFFFRHLPFYIAAMSANTRDETVLRELLLNVMDEIGGREEEVVTHSALYEQFLGSIGVTAESLASYRPLPTSVGINDGIRELYADKDIVYALGGLFADETMSASMVSKLNDGLKVSGRSAEQRFFFMLHMDVEVGHSNSVFNAILADIGDGEKRQRFERGTHAFLDLLERFWDGVAERVQIDASSR